jgi:tetraacyldisaccharide 4'-kinase
MQAPEFWQKDGAAARLLAPLGAAYGLLGGLQRALARPRGCGRPVVCVGNLVAGGAGKTPVARAVAERLGARGAAVHFLIRGYGGREHGPLQVDPARHDAARVGDEALLLARQAPTWVARDRPAGAAAAAGAGAEVIVMDDGFQNPALAKDLSLLVVDGAYGFGNGRLLPAGPLREGVEAGLARADAVVLLGADARGIEAALGPRLPLLQAALAPAPSAAGRLAGRRVLAFAGIARPEKFFATLRDLGAELAETEAFPDHHPFRAGEVEGLIVRARALDALPVTTEKDLQRLPAELAAHVEVLPVAVDWQEPARLDELLARLSRHG